MLFSCPAHQRKGADSPFNYCDTEQADRRDDNFNALCSCSVPADLISGELLYTERVFGSLEHCAFVQPER